MKYNKHWAYTVSKLPERTKELVPLCRGKWGIGLSKGTINYTCRGWRWWSSESDERWQRVIMIDRNRKSRVTNCTGIVFCQVTTSSVNRIRRLRVEEIWERLSGDQVPDGGPERSPSKDLISFCFWLKISPEMCSFPCSDKQAQLDLPLIHHWHSSFHSLKNNNASEEVILQLIKSKCIPVLLDGLEACPLTKSDLSAIDFVVSRFFMKLFRSSELIV